MCTFERRCYNNIVGLSGGNLQSPRKIPIPDSRSPYKPYYPQEKGENAWDKLIPVVLFARMVMLPGLYFTLRKHVSKLEKQPPQPTHKGADALFES
jgi:hypothetical protein